LWIPIIYCKSFLQRTVLLFTIFCKFQRLCRSVRRNYEECCLLGFDAV
jgi:hypothetical protein